MYTKYCNVGSYLCNYACVTFISRYKTQNLLHSLVKVKSSKMQSTDMSVAMKLLYLLCLPQVKFMKSKPGCAMAEMSDALSVERAITNLSNIEFFGSAVQLS